RWNELEDAAQAVELLRLAMRKEQAARDLVSVLQAGEEALDVLGAARARAVQHQIAAEVRIAGEDLVGALAGEDDLVAALVDRAAEEELGDAVRIEAQRLAVPDRIGEVVGELIVADRDGVELGARARRHLGGDGQLLL